MNKKVLILLVAVVLVVIASLVCFTVTSKDYVIITQFGRPVKIIRTPGLYAKLPGFLQTVNRLDRRIQTFQTNIIQLLLGDQNPLIIACYVCWHIDDPLVYFQSVVNMEDAEQKLSDMVNSQLGAALGEYAISNIISTVPGDVRINEIEREILKYADINARSKYGIGIVGLGIRRLAYPSIVSEAVYQRMRAEREKEASKYRAEGREESVKIEARTDREAVEILAMAYKEAEVIKGEGDRQAMAIYADAFSKDEDFFQFMKSLEVYKDVLGSDTTLILSTQSEIFKYFNNPLAEERNKKRR